MKKNSCSPKRINDILNTLDQTWPNAKCELAHNNNFQLLIAVVLSAQATDISVNKALKPLFKEYPNFSPYDLVKMGEAQFLNIIKSIGLAPTKAKNSLKISSLLIEKYEGQVPLTREELESLPGVGRKTANVVLNVACHLPTIAVDTHVERVSIRLGFVNTPKNRLEIEECLLKITPKKYAISIHHLLIFHGRYMCTARAPKCTICPVEAICPKVGL